MANFWELKTLGEFYGALTLRDAFPELKNLSVDDITDSLSTNDIVILQETRKPVPLLVRLTFPFGVVALLLLIITLPLKFMITGSWHYKWMGLNNWFKALGF